MLAWVRMRIRVRVRVRVRVRARARVFVFQLKSRGRALVIYLLFLLFSLFIIFLSFFIAKQTQIHAYIRYTRKQAQTKSLTTRMHVYTNTDKMFSTK
jgi:hypothetical protein